MYHLAVNRMVVQPIQLPVSVDQLNVLLIQDYSVSNQAMVQEVVIKLLIQLPIHKLKVVHVVRYREELIFRIKQRARLRQVILVSVIQRRMKSRSRTIHRGATAKAMAFWSTTQIPPPQHPVPPPTPVFVYLHQNVQKSMEMNQTLQSVSVVPKDVLLLVRIAINLLVCVVPYHRAAKKMDVQPIVLPVSVDHQNVLLILASIVLNLLVRVLDHLVHKLLEVPPIQLHVNAVLQDVLLTQVYFVTDQTMVLHGVTKLLIQLPIHKLKVIHVVRCLKELILPIKQRARRLQVILV
jgi:hypothetical protein